MPQPYLPTFANKPYAIGFNTLNERPAFASAIGRCIGTWSYVDNEVQGLFGILLGIESPPVYRLFQLFHRGLISETHLTPQPRASSPRVR